MADRTFIPKIPVAPSMDAALAEAHIRPERALVDRRILQLSACSIVLALVATVVAQLLTRMIGLITNLAFYHRVGFDFADPSDAPNWGPWVIGVPIVGAIIVGFMARYGSKAIRGHGIPEAMENVLLNESRIPRRMTFLKPISAAIAIGTGGPFGAEGPIIATGGALGSWIGQTFRTTAQERKTLLAAGAAAGMTATFGSPVSAVLLAVELLLFEFRPRSLIPVSLAAAAAAATRIAFKGMEPAFKMPALEQMSGGSIAFYIALGALVGVLAVVVTKILYWIEDGFEHLPVHWMWWPAIGAVAVGVVGYFHPKTLGVGYSNIDDILSGGFAPAALGIFCVMKFISWSISLGSGTSGGTLAPLFTIGGGAGALLGVLGQSWFPDLGVDVRVAALVGMAAMFAGASRALLASVVFAFETTQQPFGLLPLLGGCSAAFFASCYLMRNSIMTEKIARRGVRVPSEYDADYLDRVQVREVASSEVHFFTPEETVERIALRVDSGDADFDHQGFPVVATDGTLVGVITRRDFVGKTFPAGTRVKDLVKRKPITVFDEQSLREAADLMSLHGIGRLPVVTRKNPTRLIAILTRSDLLAAHRRRLVHDHVLSKRD